MAKITINFQANVTGIHHVGYRTYNDGGAYTVIDVDVSVPGSFAAEIDVPGNLYCAYVGIQYSGYLIAACQDQTDSNEDGVPDLALTWMLTLVEQEDPCIKTQITCHAVIVLGVTIGDPGSGCTPDGTYSLVFTEANMGDMLLPAVGTVTIAGGIAVSTVVSDGGLYRNPPTITDMVPSCGDGVGYSAIMKPDCNNILLASYICNSATDLSGNSSYALAHNESLTICALDSSAASLPMEFAGFQIGNCHCEMCGRATIDASLSTSGTGKVSYQTCWDDSNGFGKLIMISQIVNFGETIDLGCILLDTVHWEDEDLDSPILLVTSVC